MHDCSMVQEDCNWKRIQGNSSMPLTIPRNPLGGPRCAIEIPSRVSGTNERHIQREWKTGSMMHSINSRQATRRTAATDDNPAENFLIRSSCPTASVYYVISGATPSSARAWRLDGSTL